MVKDQAAEFFEYTLTKCHTAARPQSIVEGGARRRHRVVNVLFPAGRNRRQERTGGWI